MTPSSNENHYRWNFTVNLLDGASYWFGYSFISTSTIFPLFISKLTDSLWPIGLISLISSAGWFLPQLISARITEGYSKMKVIVVGWGLFLERLPIWMMVLSAFLAKRSPQLALISFLVCFTWFSLGAGVVAPSWMALVAKLFSPEKRGSFLGVTMFVGAGMGVLSSAASAWLLENHAFPNSFIMLFAIAAVFMTLSWFFLSLTREPEAEEVIKNQDWQKYSASLLQILKNDQNYRRFVLSNIVIALGGMGAGFITISAIQRFQVSDATVGLYTFTMLAGQTIGFLVLGKMADRFGHKLSLEIGILAMVLAFSLTIFMPSPSFYFVVYALMGINFSSGIVSGMLVVWEFCETSRVPTYSGLVNTTRGIFGLISPIIATQIANMSYGALFSLCAILSLSGLLMMRLWVKEPRWHTN